MQYATKNNKKKFHDKLNHSKIYIFQKKKKKVDPAKLILKMHEISFVDTIFFKLPEINSGQ